MDIDTLIKNDMARIVPWDTRYLVTCCGEVFSRARHRNQFSAEECLSTWRKLKLSTGNGDGRYLAVNLGAHKRYFVHNLVAMLFIGVRPDKQDTRHKDGNMFNNCVSNLEYGTRKENMRDAMSHGWSSRGINNPQNKFSEECVQRIRKKIKTGAKLKDIALSEQVSYETVYQIKTKRRWAWLSENQ